MAHPQGVVVGLRRSLAEVELVGELLAAGSDRLHLVGRDPRVLLLRLQHALDHWYKRLLEAERTA